MTTLIRHDYTANGHTSADTRESPADAVQHAALGVPVTALLE